MKSWITASCSASRGNRSSRGPTWSDHELGTVQSMTRILVQCTCVHETKSVIGDNVPLEEKGASLKWRGGGRRRISPWRRSTRVVMPRITWVVTVTWPAISRIPRDTSNMVTHRPDLNWDGLRGTSRNTSHSKYTGVEVTTKTRLRFTITCTLGLFRCLVPGWSTLSNFHPTEDNLEYSFIGEKRIWSDRSVLVTR